jgi:RNA recognition motif-containing protein
MKRSLDSAVITPSDYTVMITNLPASVSEQELGDFLELNGRPVLEK